MSDHSVAMDRSEYEAARRDLEEFGKSVTNLIEQLIRAAGWSIHSIDYRIKSYDSARDKLGKNVGKYSGFSDLTDLLGIRVITYFGDQVDDIANLLKPELNIDVENSVDKRARMDPDRFGYMSLHFVAQLSNRRAAAPENQPFSGMRFELQIRSILQHAWAEIEHDLGYKNGAAVPQHVRRRFSRLAGLLELADDEFEKIRDSLDKYERRVSRELQEDPRVDLDIDKTTLALYLKSDPTIGHLDRRIAEIMGCVVSPAYYGDNTAAILPAFGIRKLALLRALISERSDYILTFTRLWMERPDKDEPDMEPITVVGTGISLFYLIYVLVGQLPEERIPEEWGHQFYGGRTAIIMDVKRVWPFVVYKLGEPPQLPELQQ